MGDHGLLCIRYLLNTPIEGIHSFSSKLGHLENKWDTINSCPRMRGVNQDIWSHSIHGIYHELYNY